MQKMLALGLVATMVLAVTPAQADENELFMFTLDEAALAQPGAMIAFVLDEANQPSVRVVTSTVDVFGPFANLDTCVTAGPAVNDCSGLNSHTASAGAMVPAGVYGGLLGPARIDTTRDYGAGGKLTWSCFLSNNGMIVGVFFFPPGSGYCTYTSFGFGGSWILRGAVAGGIVGPVAHVSN